MSKIGALAFGSLIDSPGEEIEKAIVSRTRGITTPFRVEFARSSKSRSGAPTLVPVNKGGAKVKAELLVFKHAVSQKEARDMLWRRETGRKRGNYNSPRRSGRDAVLIKSLSDFAGLDTVLYVDIPANISPLTPEKLAQLAIKSSAAVGTERKDGISYLIAVKRNGIVTPLMAAYEKEILRQSGTKTLEDALAKGIGR